MSLARPGSSLAFRFFHYVTPSLNPLRDLPAVDCEPDVSSLRVIFTILLRVILTAKERFTGDLSGGFTIAAETDQGVNFTIRSLVKIKQIKAVGRRGRNSGLESSTVLDPTFLFSNLR